MTRSPRDTRDTQLNLFQMLIYKRCIRMEYTIHHEDIFQVDMLMVDSTCLSGDLYNTLFCYYNLLNQLGCTQGWEHLYNLHNPEDGTFCFL